jgi:site-specific recombinase XerD
MLRLVPKNSKQTLRQQTAYEIHEAEKHHHQLLESFIQSHTVRNHSIKTIDKHSQFLTGWFKSHNPIHQNTLYTWQAMEPVSGRKRVTDYGKALLESGIANPTVRSYFSMLKNYFDYVLDHPFIIDHNETVHSIRDLYGSIAQPISVYDIPVHAYGSEFKGLPLDPETILKFYKIVCQKYFNDHPSHIRARNYAMIVLAGETGLRADELSHLEIKDLFFDSHKVQTRFAKGNKGSGKKVRLTLFPPFSRDTMRYYLKNNRPHLQNATETDYLFPSKQGDLMTYSSMHTFLKETVAIANRNGFSVLPHMSWHWFRRIFATRFIEAFPDQLPVLISLLGHVSPSTVHCYIHHSQAWMNKRVQSVLEKVEFNGN